MTDLVERLRKRLLPDDRLSLDTDLPLDVAEAATALEAKDKELEALRGERDQWDRRVAYDELKAREYENRATQQGQIDALTIRAETAERERNSYEKLYNDEVVERLRAERERAKEIEFIAIWSHDGSLQTFEDRERFRRAARAITGED